MAESPLKFGVQHVVAVHITEDLHNGTKVKTATVPIPAGALLEDVCGEVLAYSTAATSSLLRIGDGDDAQGYLKDQALTTGALSGLSTLTVPRIGGFFTNPSQTAVFPGDGSGNYGTNGPIGGKHYPNGGNIIFELTTEDDGTHNTLDAWVWCLYALPSTVVSLA